MKKINKKIKFVILSIIVLIITIIYAVYFYHSKIYKEFEETELTKELIPYEEDKQKTNANKETKVDNLTDEEYKIDENDEVIIVHITGAVRNWGIIELPMNSRIADAIEKAGGLTEEADISNVNLAYILEDGMKVRIPSINDIVEDGKQEENYISKENGENVVDFSKNNSKSVNDVVNINTATQTELETLPGIGTSTALKIVNYRNENGKFESIEDIKNVSGIGEAKFNNIKRLICI
jgi:competence protein ComEA